MVYRDALGKPEPRATVSVFGGGSDAYYALTAASDSPTRRWAIDIPVADIVRQLDADGYDCTVGKDGYNRPVIQCVHRATAAAQSCGNDRNPRDAELGYIRFGALPPSGRSRNHADGSLETGVSVLRARIWADGYCEVLASQPAQIADTLALQGKRPVYRVWGDEMGIGSDGEPLLRVSRIELLHHA